MRRVYLPANEAVPAKYQGANWVDRGTWEARKTGAADDALARLHQGGTREDGRACRRPLRRSPRPSC